LGFGGTSDNLNVLVDFLRNQIEDASFGFIFDRGCFIHLVLKVIEKGSQKMLPFIWKKLAYD
jgi:hypothetical protein